MSPPDEELLSAYLDGELSAEERSRVEQFLAESPEGRQVLDELRSIQTSLQRIPRARLGHDFADQVLRQAEKELLSVVPGSEGHALESDAAKPNVVLPVEHADAAKQAGRPSWERLRRPVIWASLTLAAGLLIMFLDRDVGPKLGRQVAMAPGTGQDRQDQKRADAAAEERERAEFGAPPPALHDSVELPLAESAEAKSRGDDYGRSESAPAGAAGLSGTALKAPEHHPPPSAVAGSRAPAVGKPSQPDSGMEANRSLVEEKLEPKGGNAAGLAGVKLEVLGADESTLVVWCDVAPGTNYSESFRQLLAGQNIRWESEEEVPEAEKEMPELAAKTEPTGKLLGESERDARLGRLGGLKRLAEAEQAVFDTNNEVVLVEAAQPQIEAVLAAIDAAAGVFVNVDVETPPDASKQQQQLERFARRHVSPEKLGELADDATERSKKRDDSLERGAAKPGGPDSQSTAGKARRLTVRAAPAPEETVGDEARKDEPEGRARANDSREEDMKKPTEPPRSFGLDMLGDKKADKGRVQVLFVLHPVDSAAAPGDATPPDDND
ncbi:MAG TPA: zf-HC2 domain-containing protein [Pirellulales bacterium]|nr:zf-HC2 domain-containing protein [Pirellulales bacterium]